jgi:hypothetical protein
MNPWSPSPCTVGASRTADERTPRSAKPSNIASVPIRGDQAVAGSGRSVSTAISPRMPDAITSGRPEPSSRSPKSRTAALSTAAASACALKSWMKAVWMMPSAPSAPARRLSRSVMSPRCTWAPAAVMASAEASDRARPTT